MISISPYTPTSIIISLITRKKKKTRPTIHTHPAVSWLPEAWVIKKKKQQQESLYQSLTSLHVSRGIRIRDTWFVYYSINTVAGR